MNKRLQLRVDDGEYVIHDPLDGSDAVLLDDSGSPIREGNFLLAKRATERDYPGDDVILV